MEETKFITCEIRNYSQNQQSHIHNFGQFLFPLEGTMNIKINNEMIKLNKNIGLFIPPFTTHSFNSLDINKFLILDVSKDLFPFDINDIKIEIDDFWASIRNLLLFEMNNISKGSLDHLILYIISKLPHSIPKSIEYIQCNISGPIYIKDLAQIENYHPNYYLNWFKQKTGMTPNKYIQKVRLEKAKYLIKEKNDSLTVISQKIGFNNSNSFSRWFKIQEGISPLEYKKSLE